MPQDVSALIEMMTGQRRLLIVVHDNPDPDALASACALAHLAKTKAGLHTRIACEGVVGRAENRAVRRELKLKIMRASQINWDKWPLVALVDTQPGAGNNSLPPWRVPDIVIDHHPLRSRTRARYLDVRPGEGACATIVAQYLFATEAPIAPELAAGICYAISSDTQDLAREATSADTEAYLRLYPLADKRALGRILHPRLPHDFYAVMARAVLSAFTYSNVIGSHLGEVGHPDSVSLVADLLVQHDRIGWSIVTGVCKDVLHISLREHAGHAHAGRMLRRVLGERGHAGGHGAMAGGQIALKEMAVADREKLQRELVDRLILILRRRSDVTLRPLLGEKEVPVAYCKVAEEPPQGHNGGAVAT